MRPSAKYGLVLKRGGKNPLEEKRRLIPHSQMGPSYVADAAGRSDTDGDDRRVWVDAPDVVLAGIAGIKSANF